MKKITMSVVVVLFVLITLGQTGCMSDPENHGAMAWDRPDAGDMNTLPVEWNN
jgi:hypothetical protein